MASSEVVEQIVEPLPITEVEGYLKAEVEAAVNIVKKSTEIQLQHTSQQESAGFPDSGLPSTEDDDFLESFSDGVVKASSSGEVNGQVLVGIEKMSTPQESEVENQKEATTINNVVTEEGKVPEKENPAQDVVSHGTEILDKSGEANGKEEQGEEETAAADNGVQNSTEVAEAIEKTEIAEATTSVDETDDILPEVEMQTKEVSSDLGTKSNDDATDALDTAVSNNIVKQEEVHDKSQTTSIGEAANETVHAESWVEKEETSQEEIPGNDVVDAQVQEPLKEAGTLQDLQTDDPSPDAEAKGLESVRPTPSPVEENNEVTKEEELKTEGIVEQGETVEIPQDKFEDSETVEQRTAHDTDEKPSPETTKGIDMGMITQPEDKNEEAEGIKKETTETVDEPSLGHEEAQDHQSSVTTVHTSMESDNMAVESDENSKGLEEVVEKKVENEASETGKVSEEAQQLAIPVSSEAEESSSGKLDDVIAQEKAEIPKEDSNEDLVNENKATDSFEAYPVEEVVLQKDEENVELSNLSKSETAGEVESSIPRETEQNDEAETITETLQKKRRNESSFVTPVENGHDESKAAITETDESAEKEISEDKELDLQKNEVEEIIEPSSFAETDGFAVSQNTKDGVQEVGVKNVIPEKEHEAEAVQENPEELVSERETITEGDKAAVVQKEEELEIVQAAKEADKLDATKGMPEAIEVILGKEVDKESVTEETALPEAEGGASVKDLKPEAENQIEEINDAKQATDVTKEVHDEVAKGDIEESNEETKANEELVNQEQSEDCIEEMDEIMKPNVVTEETEKQGSSDIKEIDTSPVVGERVDPAEESEKTLMKETVVKDESLNTITTTEVAEEETTLEEAKIQDEEIDEPNVKSKDLSTTEAQPSQEPASGDADHEQNNKQQHTDTVFEYGNPEEDKLDPVVNIEEEVKENLELVAESQGVEVLSEIEAIPESAELHSQEAVIENTEEKTRDVSLSQNDTPEEISLQDVESRELEVDAKEGDSTGAVEDEIKQVSDSLEVTAVDKAADDESAKEEKSEAQHQAQPSALLPEKEGVEELTKTEEMEVEKVEVSIPESEAADVTESERPEDALKEELIPASDEMERTRDASDSSLQTISDQALPIEEGSEEKAYPEIQLEGIKLGDPVSSESKDKTGEAPEIVEDTPKQTETREIPESALNASESKPEEEKFEPPEVDKRADFSVPETTTAAKESSAEEEPKQAEESPVQQEEELNLNATQQVENDVQDIGNDVQKGDAPAETDERTKEISESHTTPDTPPPSTTMAEEPQQVSREFNVTKEESVEENESEVQPPAVIPEEEQESSARTEEIKEEVMLETEGEPYLLSTVESSEAANVQERDNPEDEPRHEIAASDSTLKTISESNEAAQEVQSLPEEHKSEDGESYPEIQVEGKQHRDSDATENQEKKTAEETEVFVKDPEVEEETQKKEVQDEVTVPSADIKEEVGEIYEETPEDEPKQTKEAPVQQEEVLSINQVEPEVANDVEESGNLQKRDVTAETESEEPQQVSREFKVRKEETVEENESDVQPPAVIPEEENESSVKIEEMKEEVLENESEAANVQERGNTEDELKHEIAASDSTLKTISESNEAAQEAQSFPQEHKSEDGESYPEIQLEGKQHRDSDATENQDKKSDEEPEVFVKVPEVEEETQKKEVQDEVTVPSADIKEEFGGIYKETPEDEPKQTKEAPAQQEEVLSNNQVEAEVANDVVESGNLQKGDVTTKTESEEPQQVSREFKVMKEESVEENESEIQPPEVIPEEEHESSVKNEEMKEEVQENESEAANVQERENPEDELKHEIAVSDSALKTISENQAKKTAEEPEVFVKVPEVEEETQKKGVQDEVIFPLADIKEEAIRIPEPAAEVISKEIPENNPKQEEEEEEEEEPSVNHGEAEVENVNQESENLQKGDTAATEVAEETQEVSESLATSDSPAPTIIAGEPSRQEKDSNKQTEGECKPEEGSQEVAQEKEVQDEVIVPSADIIKEEIGQVSDEAPEDKTKQSKEALAQQEEVANDVEESENLQGDVVAETVEETPQSLSTAVFPAPKTRQEQGSRDFQVSELEPRVEKGAFGGKEANHTDSVATITEEIKEASEVVTKFGSQETKGPVENEISSLQTLLVEKPEGQSHQTPEIKPEESETSESVLVKELELEPKISDEESLVTKESTVEEEKDASVFEFQGFEVAKEEEKPETRVDVPPVVQHIELEQQVTENKENKEAAKPSEKSSNVTAETANETSDSALEVSPHQEVINKPEDKVVNETQQKESTAEQLVIKDKKIIQVCSPTEESKESQPESEGKNEKFSEEEIIQLKESQCKELYLKTKNADEASQPIEDETTTAILGEPLVEKEIVNKEINIPSEETKLKTEEQDRQAITEATNAAETTTVIDKELDTQISQRDQEAETVNPAKISLFDMMQQSTRVTQVDLDLGAEDKEEKAITTGDETKAEAEKAKSDGEKEEKEEGYDENEHKNDSGSDGLVIVEAASKETETAVKVVSPKKKSHNILSEVGSKVKHSISKVKKVITGKSSSSNHTKQNSS